MQLEASFGPPVDEAAKLRAVSAQGLLRTRYSGSAFGSSAIAGGSRTRGPHRRCTGSGRERWRSRRAFLRLKVLTGDSEAAVLGDCFAGLLAARPTSRSAFVARYLDAEDDAVAEAAMLALGESRLRGLRCASRKMGQIGGKPSEKDVAGRDSIVATRRGRNIPGLSGRKRQRPDSRRRCRGA